MIGSAIRSRLFELRRDRQAAQRSAELLDHKREALLREILRRDRKRAALRTASDDACRQARARLSVARMELGLDGVESAAMAQSARFTLRHRTTSVMGVRIAQIEGTYGPYRPEYGAAATSESLDEAGAAFGELLPHIVQLAEQETAIRRLRSAMRKTSRLLNALRKVLLPHIEREIRRTIEGIEEEERDEFVRRDVLRRANTEL